MASDPNFSDPVISLSLYLIIPYNQAQHDPTLKLGSQNNMKGERQKVGNEEYISASVKGTEGGIKIVFFETQEKEHVNVF